MPDFSLRATNISVLRIQRTICCRVNSSDARHRIDSFSNGLYREMRHISGSTPDVSEENSFCEYVARNAWIISFARVAFVYVVHIPQRRFCDGYSINRKPVRMPSPSISDLSNSIHSCDSVYVFPERLSHPFSSILSFFSPSPYHIVGGAPHYF